MKVRSWIGWRTLGAVVSCSAALLACGGGGGDATTSPPAPAPAAAATVSVYAGALQRAGSADGVGAAAKFNGPARVAQDTAGNVFVADSGNHVIRKISPAGVVTTLAGAAGQSGSADGFGTAARFSRPVGIAVDSAGNVYVGDTGNGTLRKISAAGFVSTLAGAAGQFGVVDGPAAAARFGDLRSLATDRAGNIYVVDSNSIRKVAPDGTVSAFAGRPPGPLVSLTIVVGNGTQARFFQLSSVTVDGAGNVYAADTSVGCSGAGILRKFNSNAQALPFGPGADGFLYVPCPVDIAADDAGNVFVAATGLIPLSVGISQQSLIVAITPDGLSSTTTAGAVNDVRTVDGPVASARFEGPTALALGPNGRIVVAETSTSAIRVIDTRQGTVSTLAGGSGGGFVDGPPAQARFNGPQGLAAAPDGTLFVADLGNHSLRRIGSDGRVFTVAVTPVPGPASAAGVTPGPRYVAVNAAGTVVVTNIEFIPTDGGRLVGELRSVDAAGRSKLIASNTNATGLAMDGAGNLYFAEGRRVTVVAPNGSSRTLADLTTNSEPQSLAVDAAGNVYFATVRTVGVVDAAGKVQIRAGRMIDGAAKEADFQDLGPLAVDPAGNIYVNDRGVRNSELRPDGGLNYEEVRKITPQGAVSTIADVSAFVPAVFGRSLRGLAWVGGALYATINNAVIKIAPVN